MPSALTASLALDRARCAPNETVDVELRVVNAGGDEVVVGFSSGMRYDVVVERDGTELWRWSEGRAFAQMLGEETIPPRGGALAYRVRVPAPSAPGRYRVVATLASYDRPLAADEQLLVEQRPTQS